MAFYKFLRGSSANLASATVEDGAFYLTTDTHQLFVGQGTEMYPVNEGVVTVANIEELPETAITGSFYYATAENVLCVYNGQAFVQINPDTDTGATSVEVVGEGNAITEASYDAKTRKITLTKGETFATKNELETAVSTLEGKITDSEYDDTEVRGLISGNTTNISTNASNIATNTSDIEALEGRATTVEGKVDTLIGEDTNKSVRTIANEELAAQLLSGDAEADFKTLQELASWLENHPEDVADINSSIEGLHIILNSFFTEADGVRNYTNGAVKTYIDEAIAALKIGDYAKASDLTALAGRVTQIETDLNTETTGLKAKVGANTGAIDANAQAIVALQNKDTALEEAIGKKAETSVVTGIDGRVTTNTENIATNTSDIATIKGQITSINNDKATKTELSTAIEGVNNTIAANKAITDKTQEDLDVAEGKIEALEQVGAQANVIETVKVNGVNLPITDKAVDVTVPTGSLASKNEVAESDLAVALATKINNKLDSSEVTGDLLTHNASEFATAAQGTKADTAVQKVTVMGKELVDGGEFSTSEAKTALGLGTAAYTDATAYATAEQGGKADTAVQTVETGVTNGTIKVDGTEVAVAGLGTAAYTNATAYATAEQGAKADTALQAADVANKADKATTLEGYGITDAYTKDEINALEEELKKYADDNDANATYSIEYDNSDAENPVIKLVGANGGATTSIPAKEFIKDGMLSSATYDKDTQKLTLTWNTDAGVEATVIELNDLVDTYTGSDAIDVSTEGVISVKAGTIGATQLDEATKASLAKADSALQEHQDISNLATKGEVEEVAGDLSEYVEAHANDYTNTQIDTKVSSAITDLGIDGYVKKTDAPGYGDILTKTDAATLYATAGHNHDDKYDAINAAANVQGNTDKTVKDVADLVSVAQKKADDAYALAETKATMAEVNSAITNAGHASQANLEAHTTNGDIHVTTTDKANWNAAEGNAKAYADGLKATIDAAYVGADSKVLEDAKAYVDAQLLDLLSWGTF